MNSDKRKTSGWIKLLILAGLAAAIVLGFRLTPVSISSFTPEKIKLYVLGFGVMAPLVFVAIYSLRSVVVVLPVGIMSLAGGLVFGKWWGTLYILTGATLGSCISFLIARYFGRSFIEARGWMGKGRMKMFDESSKKHGFRFVLFVRLVPLFQYDAVNFGLGITSVKYRDYALGTFLGMIPGAFINAFLGSSIENVMSIQFFVALGLLLLLMAVPAIYRIRKKAKQTKPADPVVERKTVRGKCPGCSGKMGALSTLAAWDNWGRFLCPGCGGRIGFRGWWMTVVLVFLGLIIVEQVLSAFLVSNLPLWLSFSAALVLSVLVMLIVPMVWRFGVDTSKES